MKIRMHRILLCMAVLLPAILSAQDAGQEFPSMPQAVPPDGVSDGKGDESNGADSGPANHGASPPDTLLERAE